MKRIIVSLAIVLVTILLTLSLQNCFVPYNGRDDRGDHRGDQGGDRDDNWERDRGR
jgi:hypothetical protein